MTANISEILKKNNEKPDYLYRSGVGIMILNKEKKIFVGKRIDNNSDAWQMPQGGLDAGESEDLAMLRELKEETGIIDSNIKLLKKSAVHYYYNLPYKLQKKFWGGKYLGQKQRWYLIEFLADDSAINIKNEDPEFSDWKWVDKNNIINSIVFFKRKMYEDVLKEFKDFL
ncbi:MAG: RNA pyrophosphohydrolase [Rickettsiales bacterium]|nr:RNA pyrophosphohydrolase [Rickettsiales bacterium]